VAKKRRKPGWFRKHWKKVLGVYLALLAGSHLFLFLRKDPEPAPDQARNMVELNGNNLAYLQWGGTNKKKPPVILLHGSPSGGATDFRNLGPEIARDGRLVIAIDRWGFGESESWVDDYSFDADAMAVLGLMDQLGIGTAHLAGWSYGAAPAIVLAEREPGRIRSVTMIGGVGMQEGEGSGNYLIEHGKYAVNLILTMVLPELIPHYGLIGSRGSRHAFARDFWDCDQRKLKWQLQKMDAPLLLIHGKDDFLVPSWVAQEHHALKQGSRLVVLDAGHFFPLEAAGSDNLTFAAEEMRRFLTAADAGRTATLAGVLNETSRQDLRAMWNDGPPLRGYKAWWLVILPGLMLGFTLPRTGGVLAGLGGGWMMFDWVTGVLGVVIGATLRRGESTRPRKAGTVILCAIIAAIPAVLTLRFF
jgi:pimeloyl-ACP methyl ester carboxylesterase